MESPRESNLPEEILPDFLDVARRGVAWRRSEARGGVSGGRGESGDRLVVRVRLGGGRGVGDELTGVGRTSGLSWGRLSLTGACRCFG